jgi:TonB family protein
MKTKLCLVPVIAALVLAWAPAAQAEDFYVRIEFLLGISGIQGPGPGNPIASLYPFPAFVQLGRGEGESGDSPSDIERDLTRIYRLDQVYGLAESTLRWDDRTRTLPGLFIFEREIFRLDLEPMAVRPKRIKLRLAVSRVRSKPEDLQRVLNTDLVATLDDPVVVGFSHSGQPYFLWILVTKTRPVTESPAGGAGRERSRENAVTPLPVRRVDPKVPENIDPARLEGEVVLKVTVDESGKVADIQILKSLQPDMDRETVKAVSEWTFEPVRHEPGRGPRAFVMSFRFRPPNRGTIKEPEGAAELETPVRGRAPGTSDRRS